MKQTMTHNNTKTTKSIFIFITFLVMFLVGCDQNKKQTSASKQKLNQQMAMKQYLEKLQLPAMKRVSLWQNKYADNGLKIETAHYEIFTTLMEPLVLSEVPGFIESSYRAYQKQLPRPANITRKFKIYLFGTRSQWEAFTSDFTPKQANVYKKIKSGAYYLNGSCVTYYIGREKTFSVLAHEGWHQFNSRCFKYRLPSSIDEGVAMMFEASRYEDGLFRFYPQDNMGRLGGLKKTILDGGMIPLEKLIAMNPGEALMVEANTDRAVMAYYSQAYALVRFLREDNYGKRLVNYQSLLLGGLRGTWRLSDKDRAIASNRNIPLTVGWNRAVSIWLFEKYITDDIAQMEKEYLAFCNKIVYHINLK